MELGESCVPAQTTIYYEGLYRSERSVCGDYYCWSFIRFFEDCTYQSITSTQENVNRVARVNFVDSEKRENLNEGVYSIEGNIIKMKSDINEHTGTISGETLNLNFYVFETKKSGEKTYNYFHVDSILQDIYNSIVPETKEED